MSINIKSADLSMSGALEFTKQNNIIFVDQYAGDDLGEKFNAAIASNGREYVKYAISPGEYTLSTCVDLTDTRNILVDLRAAHIHVEGDIIAFDCTDVEDLEFWWGYVTGDETSKPKAFILHADSIGGGQNDEGYGQSVSERNKFFGGNIAGYWQYANVIHQGRERSTFTGYYQNNNDEGYVFAVTRSSFLVIDGTSVTVESPIKGDITGGGSPTKFSIYNASLFSRTNSKDGLLYLQGSCGDSKIDHVEFRSLGEPMIYVAGDIGDNFTIINVRGRVGHELGDNGADFIYMGTDAQAAPTYGMVGYLNIYSSFFTLYYGSGTPGYLCRLNAINGDISNSYIDVLLDGGSGGILTNNRSVANCSLYGAPFDGSYVNAANSYLKFEESTGKFTLDADNISVTGINSATSTVTTAVNNIKTTSIAYGCAVRNISVTSAAYTAVQVEGSTAIFENIRVISALNDGFDVRGGYNTFINCNVDACGATRDTIEFGSAATYNTVIGGVFTGDMEFSGSYNTVIGATITGDVDFITGSSNNKLIGCNVGGTITDNGTDNTH